MKKLTIILLVFLFSCKTTPWKDGKIYYNIEKGFTFAEISLIERAMDRWEECGHIQFIPTKNKNSVYKIKRRMSVGNTGGTSTFGYNKNRSNHMILYQVSFVIILHELGHCLGLQHEHQRLDRDKYIKINWDNVYRMKWHNFYLLRNRLINVSKYKYDYRSIMHYKAYAFSKNNKPTIKPIDKKYILEDLGNYKLSDIDCLKIGDIYKDTNK